VARRTAAAVADELKGLPAKDAGDLAKAADWQQEARRRDLQRNLQSHEEYARFLDFVKRHLERRRIYRLSLVDLSTLEITPRRTHD
jgi:hypothetical protein